VAFFSNNIIPTYVNTVPERQRQTDRHTDRRQTVA